MALYDGRGQIIEVEADSMLNAVYNVKYAQLFNPSAPNTKMPFCGDGWYYPNPMCYADADTSKRTFIAVSFYDENQQLIKITKNGSEKNSLNYTPF